jgi:lysophospholipase L1-like esterase
MIGRLSIARLAISCTAILAANSLALAEPQGTVGIPSCAAPPALSMIEAALDRTAVRIDQAKPLTIVAMGSSSTQGIGASTPEASYPSRLEAELRDHFPDVEFRVLNRGIGGEDVGEELARFGRDVFAVHPDLVIWQVGTNAVLRRDELVGDKQKIARGVALISEQGIDLILMDMQYAPKVLARPAWGEMERIIGEIAQRAHVGLFRRFEIMREWDHTRPFAPAEMIGPDGLHMTDTSYGCLANQLAEALVWNWWSHGKLAKSSNRSPDAVAGFARGQNAPSTDAP